MTNKLTDTLIRSIKPTEKTQKFFDGNGLFLVVYTTGVKVWRVRYYFEHKEKLVTLGKYPAISLKEARFQCIEIKRDKEKGIDTAVEKAKQKMSMRLSKDNTLITIAKEWFDIHKTSVKDSYANSIWERLENHIFPHLGDKPIKTITAQELLAVLRNLENKGFRVQSHKTLEHCSQIYRYAIMIGKADRNIATDLKGVLKRYPATPRVAIISPEEVGKLLRALDSKFVAYDIGRLGVLLLALTFVRLDEARLAEWSEIDLKAKIWTIPSTRMKMKKDHLVPLSNQAVKVLEMLHSCNYTHEHIFASNISNSGVISKHTFARTLWRIGYKGTMCVHGFRAMASTLLNERLGYDPDIIEKQLAHSPVNRVRAIYNRAEYLEERRQMMQKYADYLDSLRGVSISN